MSGVFGPVRLERQRYNPQDPPVWCDCHREKVLLSEKLRGAICGECRRDAGEVVLTADERYALEDELRRLIFERSDLESEASDLQDELDAVNMRLQDIADEVAPIERALGRIA